jgi:hypothetical protein
MRNILRLLRLMAQRQNGRFDYRAQTPHVPPSLAQCLQ